MATTTKPITAEDLWKMPNDQRRELVRGELRMMAPSGFDHGAIIDNLHFLLTAHERKKKLGKVLGAETGFRLARNPDTVRGADISFIAAARLPAKGRPVGFWDGAPDLAVEVISPGDTLKEVEEKAADYLAGGAKLVWVVNPRNGTITVHRVDGNKLVLRESDTLDGGDVVPGFECAVADVFA
ncbi:MAG TPA: Uma2 family endonuclease [Tepidisphaeraceae bacterium]|nr:Uma2 family endonuclease [Tepidisphaeraceae bacterium]